MKFSSFIPFFLAGAALAEVATPVEREVSHVERDYATISNGIADIQAKTVTLDNNIKSFQGAGQVDALQAAADAVLASINTANTNIAAGTPVTLAEAFRISQQVDGLISVINTSVDDAIAKKSTFQAAGVTSRVLKTFQDLQAAGATLGKTIEGKVPSAAQGIARDKTAQIVAALQRGINSFTGARLARAFSS